MGTVKLTINGKHIEGCTGETILEVAQENGIEIPNLCHDPRLVPTGACRMCLVDIKGVRGLQTSCTRKVEADMEVLTDTEEIRESRKAVLELLFSEHRGACTTCSGSGECSLQRYAYELQITEDKFCVPTSSEEEINYTTGNKAIVYNSGKCINCERCVRICREVQMCDALTLESRASDVAVTTAFGMPLNDSTCELCGQCISTCPTGAMMERSALWQGQPKDLVKTRTTCPYCGVGCQLDLNVNPKTNKVVKITSEIGVVPNEGNLCVKGKFAHEFISDDRRLTTPLIKRDGKFEEATWDEAITLVADKLSAIKDANSAHSIAGLSSAKCTNEDNYIFQKFIRAAVGTNNVDHCARLCHASTVAGLAQSFGSGAMTNTIKGFKDAKCIFIIGSNTTEAHPVIALSIKEAVVNNGARLILADPRTIGIAKYAEKHITQKPGTDVALLNAMMNVILEEGLADDKFIAERTEGFEDLVAAVKDFTPEKGQEITGIPAEDIREVARIYATAETGSIVYSMGITQHTTGTDNVISVSNLAMLTGNVGRASTGVNPLRGQNNVQGACDMAALPNNLPGYQPVEDEANREKFEKVWDAKIHDKKGLTLVEIMHDIEKGKIKGLYVMGEDPALSDPNLSRAREALDKVEFLVVQDIFMTETAEYADVVLPAFCYAEKEGTFTNTERRVQRVRKAVDPPGEARCDWKIICDISTKFGYPMSYDNAGEIMDEIASLTPIYGGMAYDRLDGVGLQWPCLDREHPGTPFLHKGEFKRGRGKFFGINFREPDEKQSDEFPMILSTGRQLYQYHTGTMTRKSEIVNQVSPTGYVEIHPCVAEKLGVAGGDDLKVSTRRGEVITKAIVTEDIEKEWIFMPFHFAEAPANMLTNDALDPTARIPEFKVCAAKVEKA